MKLTQERLTLDEIMKQLESLTDPKAVEGMGRYGIRPELNFGVSVTTLRKIAKDIGKDHDLAVGLWATGVRDARILATLTADHGLMTSELIEQWVLDFDSWDVCDGCCNALLWRTTNAHLRAVAWSDREEEFVKRAGFVLMATLAVHWKGAVDSDFDPFFHAIIRESDDERNFVKKAVNWALRGIGKRNLSLNKKAVGVAERILATDTKSGRWIARDAIRELGSEKVVERLRQKEGQRQQREERIQQKVEKKRSIRK